MKKFTLILFILVISIFGLIGCTNNDEEPIEHPIEDEIETPVEDIETGTPDDEASKTWPSSIEETIILEGNEEPITLNYFEGQNFTTYVPNDFIVNEEDSAEGQVYRFYTNYNDNISEDNYLEILLYLEGSEEPELIGNSGEEVNDGEKTHEWSMKEVRNADTGNHVMLGKHEDQYFTISLNYKPEYEEGFVPRANKIIDYIYWTDTNEYLTERNE